ncbi:lipid droplet assembly factor 1 [Cochliomyia hominivorax]
MALVSDEVNISSADNEGMGTPEDKNTECHGNSHNDGQKQQNNTESNAIDNPDVLINIITKVSRKIYDQLKQTFHYVMYDLGGYQVFDRLAQWCVQHPQMAICLLAAGIATALPVLLFFAFALSTICMTFTGFLVLEGTLLTILTMIMFGLLGAVATVLLFFTVAGFATYMGVSHVYDMYTQRTHLRNIMQSTEIPTQRNSNQNSNDTNLVN